MSEYEQFHDEVKLIANTLKVTIPKKLATFAGIKEGDQVKVLICKKEETTNSDFEDDNW